MSISGKWKRELLLASAVGCLWSAANAETVITIPPTSLEIYDHSVSFPDALRVTGGGTLVVDASPMYSVPITLTAPGGITIDTPTLLVVGPTTVLATPSIVNNGKLKFSIGGIMHSDPVQTISAAISGTGSLSTEISTVLTADNTYTGGTSISRNLQIGNGGTTGSIVGNVSGNTLTFNRSDTVVFNGDISLLRIKNAGQGLLVLTGSVNVVDVSSSDGNGIQFGDGGAGGAVNITGVLSGNVIFNRSDTIRVTALTSALALTQKGSGLLILTPSSDYVSVAKGSTLQYGEGGNTGSNGVGYLFEVVNDGTLIVNSSNKVYIDQLSGSGRFVQAGTGTTVFSSSATYTGGTTINGGTLQLGNGGTSGLVTGDIVDNAVLAINHSDTVTFGNSISGLGKLVQAGNGMTILNGNVSLAGGASVASGTLAIGDASSPSAMFVGNVAIAKGATLRGHGSIAGTLTNVSGGTVRPGLSIGTLTVSDYVQGATSTLAIDIAPTASSLLRVKNSATLDGSLSLFLSPGADGAHKYTVLSYGTHSGQFSDITLSGGLSGITYGISYGDTSMSLVAEPVAQAQVYSDVSRSVRDLADVIGGEVYAHQSTRYCHGEGDKGRAGEWICPGPVAWYQGVGGISAYDRSDLSAGFNARYAGFVGGFDVDLGGGFAVGLTAAYVRELLNVSGGGADASTNNLSLGVTADLPVFGGRLDGRLLWIKTDGETNRVVADTGYTALGHPKADTYSGSLTYRHPIVYDDLQGMAGVTFTAANLHAMSESNADVFSLGVGSHSWAQAHGDVGLKYGHIFHLRSGAILVPEVTAGVRGYFGSLSDEARVRLTGGPDFMAPTAPVDRYAFVGGLSVTAERRDGFTLALHTQERVSSSVLEASVSLEGRYPF